MLPPSVYVYGFLAEMLGSLVIWGDQMIRQGPLRPLEKLLLRSPLAVWAPVASNIYHDLLWYPLIGQARIKAFRRTPWGQLWERYRQSAGQQQPLPKDTVRAHGH